MIKYFTSRDSAHKRLVSFFIGFVSLFLFLLLFNVTEFYHDSNGYWTISFLYGSNGSLTLFPTMYPMTDLDIERFSIRGYLLPLVLYIFRGGPLNSIKLFWALWSAFHSLAFTVLLPDIFETLSGRVFSILQRLIPFALTVFMWYGLFVYPLTDAFAFSLLVCILSMVLWLGNNKNRKVSSSLLFCLLLGSLMYAAYSARSVYLYSLVIAFGIFVFLYRKRNVFLRIASIVFTSIGVVATSIPQILINQKIYEVASPKNPMSLYPGFDIASVLMTGMKFARYENYIDPVTGMPIVAYDPVVIEILQKTGNSINIFAYLKLIVKYPLEMLGIYTSHFANMIDPRYGEIYFSNPTFGLIRIAKIVIAFTLLFIGLMGISAYLSCENAGILIAAKNQWLHGNEIQNIAKFFKKYGTFVLCLIFSAIPALVMSTEPRYFLALYVILFVFLSMFCPYRLIYKRFKERPISVLVLYISLFGCCCAIWNWTFAASGHLGVLIR